MGNTKMITLINELGESIDVELLCAFEIEGYNGSYIIYTKNEKDENNNTIIYSGKIEKDGQKQFLTNIQNEEEWSKIKNVMREMTKYSEASSD